MNNKQPFNRWSNQVTIWIKQPFPFIKLFSSENGLVLICKIYIDLLEKRITYSVEEFLDLQVCYNSWSLGDKGCNEMKESLDTIVSCLFYKIKFTFVFITTRWSFHKVFLISFIKSPFLGYVHAAPRLRSFVELNKYFYRHSMTHNCYNKVIKA